MVRDDDGPVASAAQLGVSSADYARVSAEDAILDRAALDVAASLPPDRVEMACDLLIDGYDGIPDMVNALVEWTDLFASGENILEAALEAVLESHEQQLVARIDSATAAGPECKSIVAELSASDRWMPVVERMAKRNKTSSLFNLLTRGARLTEVGIRQDVMSSPELFLDEVVKLVTEFFGRDSPATEDDLQRLYKRVSALCTYDEASTTVALRLFTMLSFEAPDDFMKGFYRRVSQEIRKEAVQVMIAVSAVPSVIAQQFATRLAILMDCVSAGVTPRKNVMDALVGIVAPELKRGTRKFDADVNLLSRVFGSVLDTKKDGSVDGMQPSLGDPITKAREQMALLRMLCHVEIYEGMMKMLFTRGHRPPGIEKGSEKALRKCLCLLLAHAGLFVHMQPSTILNVLSDTEGGAIESREKVEKLHAKIEVIADIIDVCHPGCPRFLLTKVRVQKLLDGIEDPFLAKGVLLWAAESLGGGETSARQLKVTLPKHLAFLEAIAEKHPMLQTAVLDAIRLGFERKYDELDINQTEELRDLYIVTLVELVRVQMAMPIIEVFATVWADSLEVDPAHLRTFVHGMLDIVRSPYTRPFAKAVKDLLDHSRVKDALQNAKGPKLKELVLSFKAEAQRMRI